jgi:hypothetical protein
MLIQKMKAGRADGGYSRLLGDSLLGSLISKIHATVISSGSELEKLIISSHTTVMSVNDLSNFLNKSITGGVWIIPKKLMKSKLKMLIVSEIEPDFLVLVIHDKKAYVIELKDGDTFDTKKAQAEINNCKKFASTLSSFFIREQLNYDIAIKICCFNQNDKEKIKSGFKNKLQKHEIMTGEELCQLLGISYTNIVNQRKVEQEKNLDYFIDELLNIPNVKNKILMKISCSS